MNIFSTVITSEKPDEANMMPGYTASPDAAATDDVYTLPGKLQLNTLGVGGRGGYLSVITT